MFAAAGSACGSGDDAPKATATVASSDTQLPLLPTATPVAESAVGLSIAVNAGKSIAPTAKELKALPTMEINADGKKTGISIATIAKQVDAKDGAIVTIKGIRADGKTVAFVRKPLSELATTTVVVIDAQNHLSLASTSLDKSEWLQALESITFLNPLQ